MPSTLTEFASDDKGFSLISNRKLLALYNAMLACRRIAEKARAQDTDNKPRGSQESIFGNEAAIVGAAIDLTAHDTVAPALWPSQAMQAVNPIANAEAGFPHAARAAITGNSGPGVTLIFLSGKRTSQSAWLKALTSAVDKNLPILFLSLDRSNQPRGADVVEEVRLRRKGYALPCIAVDGDDVVAVYRVATESISHARQGHGPAFIDCRFSPLGDPIQNMQRYLVGKGLDPAEFAA